MNTDKSEASVGQLFGSLASDTSELVRQELQLAATEMTEKASQAARNSGMVVAGAGLVHVGCIAALVGLLAGLPPHIPLWAAAVAAAVVFAGLGMTLMQVGIRAIRGMDPVPRETLRTLQDGV